MENESTVAPVLLIIVNSPEDQHKRYEIPIYEIQNEEKSVIRKACWEDLKTIHGQNPFEDIPHNSPVELQTTYTLKEGRTEANCPLVTSELLQKEKKYYAGAWHILTRLGIWEMNDPVLTRSLKNDDLWEDEEKKYFQQIFNEWKKYEVPWQKIYCPTNFVFFVNLQFSVL